MLPTKRRRDLVRALHLLLALPLGALAYGPPEFALAFRAALQFVVFPALALSGLWLWQGARLVRWLRGADRSRSIPPPRRTLPAAETPAAALPPSP